MAATPYHLITGSDDSNIHVWPIARLLELDPTIEHEPERTLANHRASITALLVSEGANPDTGICISASRDKTCIVWNHQRGAALRTLLFASPPLCASLDPCSRAFYAATEDGSLYAVELFGEKPLLGPRAEDASTAVQIPPSSAFGAAPPEAGPASCVAVSYDGTVLLTGHPRGQILRWDLSTRADNTELANLNAAVTNLLPVPPLPSALPTRPAAVVRPFLGSRAYNFTAQLTSDLAPVKGQARDRSKFNRMMEARGLPKDALEQAILALQQPGPTAGAGGVGGDQQLQTENEELWEIINEQRTLQKTTLQRLIEAKSGNS